ncbi:MAG: alpha/beta hydrolase [Leptolyngbya sp. DLM2.Bin27]|nr:MAG: alpha/beta hydrolase [Leptolyngbya sp. DLM2.Bin27]
MPLPAEMPLRTGRMKLPLGSVFWHEKGKPGGETVVLLHGSWHESTQWLPLMQHLGTTHHCLAPDLLGFGESFRADQTPYSIALQVECLHSLLLALRINRCRLVAHSLGAWVAAQYALTYPDQVQSLAVIAPEGVIDPQLQGRWRRDRWLVAPWSPLPLVLPWLGQSPWAKALRDRSQCLRQAPAACKILFQRRAAAIDGELLQQRLEQIGVPALVLEPTPADPLTHQLTQNWLRRLPGGKQAEITAAPTPLGIDAAECAAALGQLMASLPSPPPRPSAFPATPLGSA